MSATKAADAEPRTSIRIASLALTTCARAAPRSSGPHRLRGEEGQSFIVTTGHTHRNVRSRTLTDVGVSIVDAPGVPETFRALYRNWAGKPGRGAVHRLEFDDLPGRMTESRYFSRSILGRPSPLLSMSSQVESNLIRFDDGSGAFARSPASVSDPKLARKCP